jgi:hypothetical protein
MAGAAAGVALTTGALLAATALPAQAYDPNPSYKIISQDTTHCPCSFSDPFDGTRFAQEDGGLAVKIELRDSSGSYVGKVEFHPYGDKLWVYDTKNDGDSIYTEAVWIDSSGNLQNHLYTAPGTDAVLDYRVVDLDIPEGDYVYIYVWDDSAENDYIYGAYGYA